MHPRIFVKYIWGICILRSLAVHTCVDTRIEKTCQLLHVHRRYLFPSGTITSMMSPMHRRSIADAAPKHPRTFSCRPEIPPDEHRECIANANLSYGTEALDLDLSIDMAA